MVRTGNVGRWRSKRCPGCVGICNDGLGTLWLLVLVELTESPQELFTRANPFHPISGTGPVTRRILKGPPDRPSDENTFSRLTDEWWGICSECWHTDPSKRPTMSEVAKKIEQIVCSSTNARLSVID